MSTGAGGRPRIQQMADDLGISYKKAKALMAKSRKDFSPASQRAIDRVTKGFDQENADRIAQEDTEMVLKRKDGGSIPSPEMPAEGLAKARLRNEMRKQGLDDNQIDMMFKNPSLMGKEHPMNKENNRLKRRGDDEEVIEASHGMSVDLDVVRGMGAAYRGNPRKVKIS